MSELQAVFQARRRRAEQGTSNPTADGIEFSPGASGREALNLGAKNDALQASLDGEGGSVGGGGEGYAPIDADGAKAALKRSNKFGVRHSNPPGTLSMDEPSDEELEEVGTRERGNAPPKNELQRKLEARRLKVNTNAGSERPEAADGGTMGGGPRTPKSPKVEMKWNSNTMAYEAVLSPSAAGDDVQNSTDMTNKTAGSTSRVEGSAVSAPTESNAHRNGASVPPRRSPATTAAPTSFFKRTFPAANSGSTVRYGTGSQTSRHRPTGQRGGRAALIGNDDVDEGQQGGQERQTQSNDQPSGGTRQIGGRPQQNRDFSRTVGGRSRSARSDVSNSSDNNPPGMLSALAKRYVEERKEDEQQQPMEDAPLEKTETEDKGKMRQQTRGAALGMKVDPGTANRGPDVASTAGSDSSVPEFMRMRAGLKKRSAGATANAASESTAVEAPAAVTAAPKDEDEKSEGRDAPPEEAVRSNAPPPQSQETTKLSGRVWPPVSSAAPSASYREAFPTVSKAAATTDSPLPPEKKAEVEGKNPPQRQTGNVGRRWQPPTARVASEAKESTRGGYPFRHESARDIGGNQKEGTLEPNSTPLRSSGQLPSDDPPGQKLQPWQKEWKSSRPSRSREEPGTPGGEHRKEESDPKKEAPQQRPVSSYDTAVMAARDAIDMSNQSRRSKETESPAAEVSMVRDPSLLMESSPEPSPDSSLVDEEVAEGVKARGNDGQGGQSNDTEEGDRIAQLARFVGDDVPPTPTFAASGTPSSNPAGFFADSFVNGPESAAAEKSPQQTSALPERNATFPQQPKESPGEPAFRSSDPFDPFSTSVFSYPHHDATSSQPRGLPPDRQGGEGEERSTRQSPEPLEDSQLFHDVFPEVEVEAPKGHVVDGVVDASPPTPLADPDRPDRTEMERAAKLSPIPTRALESVVERIFADTDGPKEEFARDTPMVSEALDAGTQPDRTMLQWQIPNGEKAIPQHASFNVRPFGLPLYANSKDVGRVAEPVRNPLSGNLVACLHRQNGDFVIEEVCGAAAASSPPAAVVSARVRQEELSEKLSDLGISAKIVGISSILSLAAGIHRVRGRRRVRVAALVELCVAGEDTGGCMKKMRVVGVWRWGYAQPKAPSGVARASLQSALTLREIEAEGYFDPKTLQVADGLLFLGGHLNGRNVDSRKTGSTTAAVYVAKPSVRERWLAMPVGDAAKTTVALAVSHDDKPHLAVGLSDGTVGVHSYDLVARTNRNLQRKQVSPSAVLQLLCHIDCVADVGTLSEDDCLWPTGEHCSSTETGSDQCMSLEWINRSCSSGASELPLLACASSIGLGIYHVSPAQTDHPPQQQPITKPLAMAKYNKSVTTRETSLVPKIGWLDMGPRRPPPLALLLTEQGGQRAMLCLCAVDIPWFGGIDPGSESIASRHRSIGIICQMKLDISSQDGGPSMIASPRGHAITCWHGGQLLVCEPITTNGDRDGFSLLHNPVSSPPLGLDSFGCAYQGDPSADEYHADSVLSVFSVTSCDDEGSSGDVQASRIPTQRHWLLMSTIDEAGKVTSDPLFELTCGESPTSGLVPERVIKEARGSRAAVVFSASYFKGRASSRTRIRCNPVAYAILDIAAGLENRGSSSFELRRGRDVAFLPPKVTAASEGGFYCSSLVVLDDDGASLSVTTMISSSVLPEGENERVVESIQKCSLQYEGIEGRRVFSLLSGDKPEILLYGFSKVVRRSCLLLSRHRLERDTISNQLTLIESTELGHRLWLDEGEEVLSLAELPLQDQAKRANIAVASQRRVMIVSAASSGALSIVAEVAAHPIGASLIPLGSHCVAFCTETGGSNSNSRLMYLSCLEEAECSFNYGVIATLPTKASDNALPLAIFPDRCVYLNTHSAVQTMNNGDDESEGAVSFEFPLSHTRPLLLLEPFVANALCSDGRGGRDAATNAETQLALLSIIEKFGRKYNAFPYGDEHSGGIGTDGAGVTSRVYDLLVRHGCDVAALVLLTGNVPNDGGASEPKILAPWIPMESKLSAASMYTGANATSQVLSQGRDRAAQPGPHDIAKILAREMALDSLGNGGSMAATSDATKLLSMRGNRFSENLFSRLAALMGKKDERATALTEFLAQLAPSMQCAWEEDNMTDITKVLESTDKSPHISSDSEMYWEQSFGKNKHVWDTGPLGNQESLLSLDDFESWLGTCRPSVLGKEGIEAAADTGEGALVDIIYAAAAAGGGVARNEMGSETNEAIDGRNKNWVEGIGESPNDEDNLSLYLRFSEGAGDEDSDWASEGFADLTKHGHHARIYGPDFASVEATTSSVDEGEEGKVHLLYDLVYGDGAPRSQATGIVVEAPRGGSLDVGMLHDPQHVPSRGKCTVELWYHLPQRHIMTHEIILARRSLFYEEGDDASNLCVPDEKHNVLWELAVLPAGKLELRTGAGGVVSTDDLVFWEREDGLGGWNHVCLLFSQSASSSTECLASILVNGSAVVSNSVLAVNPFGSDPAVQELNQEDIDDALERTVIIFGIGPSLGFRMTDVRVWACSRSEEDVAMMMHEYLRDAEMKRKFRVSIQKKEGGKKNKSIGKLLPPPGSKKALALAPPRQSHPKRDVIPQGNDAKESVDDVDAAFVPDFADFGKDQFVMGAERPNSVTDNVEHAVESADAKVEGGSTNDEAPKITISESQDSEDPENGQLWKDLAAASDQAAPVAHSAPAEAKPSNEVSATENAKDPQNDQLWDDFHLAKADALVSPAVAESDESEEKPAISAPAPSASDAVEEVVEVADSSFDVKFSDLLSSQVRASAAAAIIRGPPASRHFGGNRGGLLSASLGGRRAGVSPIAICGSDKSVVWFSDRDPPARTYPIGASGAVLSDVMDESGSEYMSCFLAKEKRIVVFELHRKTVVVELQMKTKLNYWRYLPREAHGGELAFVLITPVGGFHWKPLDESPRPCQVWKRGSELESKKILAYEEGGSIGKAGGNARSTVALVIASPTTPRSTVEAYCIALDTGSDVFCVSNLILGAALYCPVLSTDAMPTYFSPFIVTISMDVTSQLVLDVEDLRREEGSGAIVRGNILASTVLDHLGPAEDGEFFEPPSMSMGAAPEALCCCQGGFIAVVVRSRGLVYAYDFSSNEDLVLVGKSALGQYVVDAAIRSSAVEGQAELVLLLCESDDAKDGRVVTATISRGDGMHSQYLSSI